MANKMMLDTMPLLGMRRKPAVRRRRHGTLQSRCSRCGEAVQFKTYKTLNSFMNQGRVCDACVARNLSVATERVDPYEYAGRLAARLWIDGNGRVTCGQTRCAGQTAVSTGMRYDLNGAEMVEVTGDVAAMMPIQTRCENCGAELPNLTV